MIAMLQSLRLEQTSSAHQQLKVFKIPARYRPRIKGGYRTVCYGPNSILRNKVAGEHQHQDKG